MTVKMNGRFRFRERRVHFRVKYREIFGVKRILCRMLILPLEIYIVLVDFYNIYIYNYNVIFVNIFIKVVVKMNVEV